MDGSSCEEAEGVGESKGRRWGTAVAEEERRKKLREGINREKAARELRKRGSESLRSLQSLFLQTSAKGHRRPIADGSPPGDGPQSSTFQDLRPQRQSRASSGSPGVSEDPGVTQRVWGPAQSSDGLTWIPAK